MATAAICLAQEPEKFALELTLATADKRAELVAAHPEWLNVELRRRLVQQGNLRFASTQYTQALEIYRLVQKISEQIADKEGVATARLNIGSVYYFQGNYDLALDHYQKAKALFNSLGNHLEVGRSMFGVALTYQAQRKPNEAINTFEDALKEFEAAGDNEEIKNTLASLGGLQYELGNYDAAKKTFLRVAELSGGGESLIRVADAFYMQHDYAQALSYYQRALQQFGDRANPAEMISSLSGAGNCYYHQRNYDQALEFYQRSLTLEEKFRDATGIATRLQSIGNVHRARGDYGAALQSYFKSLSVAQDGSVKATVATTLGSIGLVRALQGDNAQAIDYFNRSLTAFETDGDQVGMARMLSYIGNTRYLQRQYEPALAAYEKSRDLHQRRGDRLNVAHVLLGIGAVYLVQQKHALALENYQAALTLYTTLGRKADVADALGRLATAHRMMNEPAKALEFAQSAAKSGREAEVSPIVAHALTEVGNAQRALGQKTEALNAFDEAIRVQRGIRLETGPEEFEANRSGVLPYLGAMETLLELDKPREALVRAEEGKTQFLREVIQPGNFMITKGMTDAERQEELKLLGDLASLKAQVYGAQDSNKSDDALKGRLSAARVAYEAFRKRIYARHPQLAVNRGELEAFNLEDLRPFVNRDTAIVEYVVAEEQIYMFVVTDESTVGTALHGRPSGPTRSSNGSGGSHRVSPLQLNVYKLGPKRADISEKLVSRELYDQLLKPAEAQLAGKSKLIVIPDGPLWDVPFEALQPASLSYAISLSALREMRKRQLSNPLKRGVFTLTSFGNPVLTAEMSELIKTTYGELRLPAAVGAMLPRRDTFAKEINATSLRFLSPMILDPSAPMYSFLILDDGFLKLWEITNVDSRARVVMLPHVVATGRSLSNGLIALSWAWFVAGTPAVVVETPERHLNLGN